MSHVSTDFSNLAEFDALAQSIAAKLSCEISLISIVAADVLTAIGCSHVVTSSAERTMSARDTICSRTVRAGHPIRIMDVQADPEIRNIPTVKAMNIGAYLGVPLNTESGMTVGAICAVSTPARIWRDSELAYLQAVADLAESKIDRHLLRLEQKALSAALAENDAILSILSNVPGTAMTVHNLEGDLVFVSAAMKHDLRLSDPEMLALPSVTRLLRRQKAPFDQAHRVQATPSSSELNVRLTIAENGLILAEWSREPELV